MNDIAKPIMNVEKCLRRISDQIAFGPGVMTNSQLAITHHAILEAISNLLDAKAWTDSQLSKRSEAPTPTAQPDETRFVREGGLMGNLDQKYLQSAPDIEPLQDAIIDLQYRVEKIERQLPQSQMRIPPYAASKQDTPPDVAQAWQGIRERAEAETKRTIPAVTTSLHVASRSLKVY